MSRPLRRKSLSARPQPAWAYLTDRSGSAFVPERFIDIRYRGPPPDWFRLAPATVIEAGQGTARLRVGRETDLAVVLAAVRDRAGLVSFSYQPPTLSELFRQAVAA
jgi:ABC-2 type transport system ATP-binding protein